MARKVHDPTACPLCRSLTENQKLVADAILLERTAAVLQKRFPGTAPAERAARALAALASDLREEAGEPGHEHD